MTPVNFTVGKYFKTRSRGIYKISTEEEIVRLGQKAFNKPEFKPIGAERFALLGYSFDHSDGYTGWTGWDADGKASSRDYDLVEECDTEGNSIVVLEIIAGKHYETIDGEKVKVLETNRPNSEGYNLVVMNERGCVDIFHKSGRLNVEANGAHDLKSEWKDEVYVWVNVYYNPKTECCFSSSHTSEENAKAESFSNYRNTELKQAIKVTFEVP